MSEYVEFPNSRSASPMIRLHAGSREGAGRLSFNKAGAELLRRLKIERVSVLWDRETGRVALKKSGLDKTSYAVTFMTNGAACCSVSAFWVAAGRPDFRSQVQLATHPHFGQIIEFEKRLKP